MCHQYTLLLFTLPLQITDLDPLPAMITAMMPLQAGQWTALLLALVALVVSAFVSGSEIAFFSVTPEQTDELEDTPWGERALAMLRQPERLLATILIANNLVNVTIVILCNYALGPVFDGMDAVWSFVLQTVILTFLILLFGEILPKLAANSDNMRWIRRSLTPLHALVTLFRPVSAILVSSSGVVNRVVHRNPDDLTPDDLSRALEITDVKAGEDKEMLEGILRFGETTAQEIMTPRVDITDLDIDSDFDTVMSVVIESGYSRLPVYRDNQDNIEGVLYSRDLLPYVSQRPEGFDWRKLLRPPYFVPPSRMIDDLLEDFRSRKMHMAVVVDEFGGTLGLVTMEDVLEEIVGDINDEYDDARDTYKRLGPDTYVFEGKTLLSDFFRITGLDEDDYSALTDDCETLAGMLLALKGDFPVEKESLVYGRCRFMVLDIVGHRITEVRVAVMPQDQTATAKP